MRTAIGLVLALSLFACGGQDGGTPSDAGDAGEDAHATPDALADAAPDVGPSADAAVPKLALDLSSITVSGLSSGGFMAVQFHVAFSSLVKGAAVFAGGPYDCSGGSLTTAVTTCALGSPAPDVSSLVAATNSAAQAGAIDDPSGLADARVFLFVGADDTVVSPNVVDSLDSYYASFVPSASIQYVNRRPDTSHTWPTLDYGSPCDQVAAPYVGKCSYDGAGAALAQLYGTLAPRADTPTGSIVPIPQGAFTDDAASHSLGDTAYLYVPTSCAGGDTCKLHVSFHGCLQDAGDVADAFYAHVGLNEWADENHLVVLYPQTTATGSNPEACWDFWGYDSPDFAKKTGPQMAMVRAMIDGIAK